MRKAEEKVKQLLDEVRPHTRYWDCYNDEPLEYNHDHKVVLLVISKQLELLRYLGTKTPDELYRDLIAQKVALKNL